MLRDLDDGRPDRNRAATHRLDSVHRRLGDAGHDEGGLQTFGRRLGPFVSRATSPGPELTESPVCGSLSDS